MVEAAKDGRISGLVGTADECPVCVIVCVAVGCCFSGSSTVQTPNGVITINKLRLNDLVLTYTPGVGTHYTEVKSYQYMCI